MIARFKKPVSLKGQDIRTLVIWIAITVINLGYASKIKPPDGQK